MNHPKTSTSLDLKIELSEDDLPPDVKDQLDANKADDEMMGNQEDALRTLQNALPKVIAKRLEAITPDGFAISEITLKISLGGKLYGLGVSGDITVKLSPCAEE